MSNIKIRCLGHDARVLLAGTILGASVLSPAAHAQSQFSVFSAIQGYAYANTETTVFDVASTLITDQASGTSSYSSFYQQDLKYSAVGNPPVSPLASVTLDALSQPFRQRGDAVGSTSASWTATAETKYGENKAGASIVGAAPAAGQPIDVSNGTTQIIFTADPHRNVYAQSTWQDLFVVTPQNPADLGRPAVIKVSVVIDGTFTQETGSFYYNIRNFDGSQAYDDSSNNYYSASAATGDLVSFGDPLVPKIYNFTSIYGNPFLITATLVASIGDAEGSVDLLHTAKVTDIKIPTNAAISFLSGASGGAYGGISGGVFGQYGSGGGGGGGGGPILPPVPEPQTYALMLAGLAIIVTVARRRGKA